MRRGAARGHLRRPTICACAGQAAVTRNGSAAGARAHAGAPGKRRVPGARRRPSTGRRKSSPSRRGRRDVRKALRWPHRAGGTVPTLGQTRPDAWCANPWIFGEAPGADVWVAGPAAATMRPHCPWSPEDRGGPQARPLASLAARDAGAETASGERAAAGVGAAGRGRRRPGGERRGPSPRPDAGGAGAGVGRRPARGRRRSGLASGAPPSGGVTPRARRWCPKAFLEAAAAL